MGAPVTFGVKFLKADILVQTLFTPKGERYPKFVCEGFNNKKELYRFTKWIKLDDLTPEECIIPDWLDGTLSPQTLQYRIYRWKSYRSPPGISGFSRKCYNNYTTPG